MHVRFTVAMHVGVDQVHIQREKSTFTIAMEQCRQVSIHCLHKLYRQLSILYARKRKCMEKMSHATASMHVHAILIIALMQCNYS